MLILSVAGSHDTFRARCHRGSRRQRRHDSATCRRVRGSSRRLRFASGIRRGYGSLRRHWENAFVGGREYGTRIGRQALTVLGLLRRHYRQRRQDRSQRGRCPGRHGRREAIARQRYIVELV